MYLQDIYTIYLENKSKKIIIEFYIKSNLIIINLKYLIYLQYFFNYQLFYFRTLIFIKMNIKIYYT